MGGAEKTIFQKCFFRFPHALLPPLFFPAAGFVFAVALEGGGGTAFFEDADLLTPFGETAVVPVLGRNKLNVYFGDKVWLMKGDKRFNALKYVHFYHRYKNLAEGDNENEFLGL